MKQTLIYPSTKETIRKNTPIFTLVIYLLISFFELTKSELKAQEYHDFGFEEKYNIEVSRQNNTKFQMPWLGGLNNVQIHSMDLNGDAFEDLVVFDRHGFRLLTFINKGIKNAISFSYQPEYEKYFPEVKNWIKILDYNCDGKKDLFTSTPGGILLFKNTGKAHPKFHLEVEPYITSLQGSFPTNILVTDVDFPIIDDMDGDQDLDIIVFFGLGSRMEFHKNMSMETYGHCDSLNFEKTADCWGDFAESDESNTLQLDACSGKSSLAFKDNEKHTGSTMLSIDFDKDGAKDLVLGDIDFPGLALLTNGATSEHADMISYTWDFPNSEHPVNLFSFPLPMLIDVDNDQDQDLIVSPFDPSQYNPSSQNYQNIWLYENKAEDDSWNFKFSDSSFLQKEMIDLGSGAMPCLYDYDNDGLVDLFVGNFGFWDTAYYESFDLKTEYVSSIALFKNIGSSEKPAFKLITSDLGNLSTLKYKNIHISVGNIDNDNFPELILGNENGDLFLSELTNIDETIPELNLPLEKITTIEGSYITPQFYDLNKDGLFDIVTGSRRGNLFYLENSGSASTPEFTLKSDNLGGVDVTDPELSYYGYSIPFFFKHHDETVLFVGSEFGHIYYYKNIDSDPVSGEYSLISSNYLNIDKGSRGALSLHNLDADDFPEMIYGNYSGGLHFFDGVKPAPVKINETINFSDFINIFPNPAKGELFVNIINQEIKATTYSIHSIDGLMLQAGKLHLPKTRISVQDLAAGSYFLLIKSEIGIISSKKLIVVK